MEAMPSATPRRHNRQLCRCPDAWHRSFDNLGIAFGPGRFSKSAVKSKGLFLKSTTLFRGFSVSPTFDTSQEANCCWETSRSDPFIGSREYGFCYIKNIPRTSLSQSGVDFLQIVAAGDR